MELFSPEWRAKIATHRKDSQEFYANFEKNTKRTEFITKLVFYPLIVLLPLYLIGGTIFPEVVTLPPVQTEVRSN